MFIAIILGVEVLAALGGFAVAGSFLFSTSAVRGLTGLPTTEGIKAMAAINQANARPMTILLSGTALSCLAAALIWLFDRYWGRFEELGAISVIAGASVFGLGAVLVTFERIGPLNKLLGTATDASGEMVWRIYRRDWVTWNRVRTAACAVASALFVLAAVLHTLGAIDRAQRRSTVDIFPTCLPCPNTKTD